jgi:hypothetical protein
MSAFELACLAWYQENAVGWPARVGATAAEFRALRLRGAVKRIFAEAMAVIESAFEEMRARAAKG